MQLNIEDKILIPGLFSFFWIEFKKNYPYMQLELRDQSVYTASVYTQSFMGLDQE